MDDEEELRTYVEFLLQEFEEDPWPSRKRIEEIAKQTGGSPTLIGRWFQRHRQLMETPRRHIEPELEYILQKEYEKNGTISKHLRRQLGEMFKVGELPIRKWLYNRRNADGTLRVVEVWCESEVKFLQQEFKLNPRLTLERAEKLARYLGRTVEAVKKKFLNFKTQRRSKFAMPPQLRQQLMDEMRKDSKMNQTRARYLAERYNLPSWKRLKKWWHHNRPAELRPRAKSEKLRQVLQVYYAKNARPTPQQLKEIAESTQTSTAKVIYHFCQFRRAEGIAMKQSSKLNFEQKDRLAKELEKDSHLWKSRTEKIARELDINPDRVIHYFKRHRTFDQKRPPYEGLTEQQRAALENAFEESPSTRGRSEQLAEEIGISRSKLNTWFTEKRRQVGICLRKR